MAVYESRCCLTSHKKIFCTYFQSLSSCTLAATYIRSSWFFPELVTIYLLHTNACFPVTYVTMSGSRKGMPRHCFVFTFSFIFVPVIKISVIISFTYFTLAFQELIPSTLRIVGHSFTTFVTNKFMSRMVQLLTGSLTQFYRKEMWPQL